MPGERKTRSDKKHRQTLRLPPRLKTPVVEMAFNHNISENILSKTSEITQGLKITLALR
ncbi:MAG: hypothetical protein RO469_14840 [Thermincola sp.]|jgi:hypothetical protein|nr:hypothetical protein [Thermincola sp.]MDT3703938.1 hypothetical protein [Thermincola sp.]